MPPISCEASITMGLMPDCLRNSSAAVSPAGPAPIISAVRRSLPEEPPAWLGPRPTALVLEPDFISRKPPRSAPPWRNKAAPTCCDHREDTWRQHTGGIAECHHPAREEFGA